MASTAGHVQGRALSWSSSFVQIGAPCPSKAGCGFFPRHHRELDTATGALSAEVLSSEYLLLYSSYGSGFLTPKSSPHVSAELCGELEASMVLA